MRRISVKAQFEDFGELLKWVEINTLNLADRYGDIEVQIKKGKQAGGRWRVAILADLESKIKR